MSKKELLEKHGENVVRVGYRVLGANGIYKTIERGNGLLVEGSYVAAGMRSGAALPDDVCAEYFAQAVPSPIKKEDGGEDDEGEEEFESVEEEYDMVRMTLLDKDESRGISIFSVGGFRGRGLSPNDRIFEKDRLRKSVEALN